MDKFIYYADEQPPETAASILGGISGPYTHLKKQRDEGKQWCSLICHLYHTYYITIHDVCSISALLLNMCTLAPTHTLTHTVLWNKYKNMFYLYIQTLTPGFHISHTVCLSLYYKRILNMQINNNQRRRRQSVEGWADHTHTCRSKKTKVNNDAVWFVMCIIHIILPCMTFVLSQHFC